jgi:hypothetical protein
MAIHTNAPLNGWNGVLAAVQAEGLPLADEMSGHPSLARYMGDGFSIITF